MAKAAFEIFEPDGKNFHLTPNWIMGAAWCATIGLLWLLDGFFSAHDGLRSLVIAILFISSIYILTASYFKHEQLNGLITGRIEFENDAINLNGQTVELKIMDSIDFEIVDYYDQSTSIYFNPFDPKKSQGVGNSLTFNDNIQPRTIYFQILGEFDKEDLYPFINEAIKLDKMTPWRGAEIIGSQNIDKYKRQADD